MWKNRKETIIEYFNVRQNIKILNTGFEFIDKNVFSPSIISISARPSIGKSLLAYQISEKIIKNNFRVLYMQLELTMYEVINRELKINNISNDKINSYFEHTLNIPIDIVENISINNFRDVLRKYKNTYPNDYILVVIDHLFLIGGTDNGKNLQPVFSTIVDFKKQGIYFLVLSQLKREVSSPERCKDGSINNQIFESDIYMSDVILQYCDLTIAMDIPYRRGITEYSKNRIKVDKNMIILTMLKNRNGIRENYIYTIDDNLVIKQKSSFEDSGYCNMKDEDDNYYNNKNNNNNNIIDDSII